MSHVDHIYFPKAASASISDKDSLALQCIDLLFNSSWYNAQPFCDPADCNLCIFYKHLTYTLLFFKESQEWIAPYCPPY